LGCRFGSIGCENRRMNWGLDDGLRSLFVGYGWLCADEW